MTYTITITEGKNKNKSWKVSASTIEEAAQLALKRAASKGANSAIRVTGDYGKSGIFQGYKQLRGGGLTSTGPNYHVGSG